VASGLSAQPAAADPNAPVLSVRLDPSYQQAPFQGWGTALAWFANVTGGWPDAQRNQLADDLYGANGLGFTVARYDIGGGDSPETTPYMRPGAAVPGYWNRPGAETPNWWDPDDPADWSPNADANQRWWLQAAKSRGADTFEAFSNSAPYFMTNSGLTSGAVNSWQDNLRSDQFDRFAAYLTGSVQRAQASTGVSFGSISPVNEPNTSYWYAGGPQEGSHWDPASQAHMVTSLRAALDGAGLGTPIAAMDETNPNLFRTDWDSYAAPVRGSTGKLNTHTYSTGGRTGARDIAKGAGTPLWMSEADIGGSVGQSFTDMTPAVEFAQHINGDIKELEPGAWVMWQAVEDYENMTPAHENANWGLIQADLTPADPATEPLRKNKKYWAMANYSRFVRPGARLINTDSDGTIAALRPNGGAVVVHTNSTSAPQTVTIDLGGFQSVDPAVPVQRYTTDATKNLQRDADLGTTAAKTFTTTVSAGSVTTFVIPGASGTDSAAATSPTGAARQLINDNSGMALAAGSTTKSPLTQRTANAADPAQQWTFTRTSGGWDSTAAYRLTNGRNGKALAINGDTLVFVTPGTTAQQLWLLSTVGDGRTTLINKASGKLLDVSGAATYDGAAVAVYQPTTGSNQSWHLPSTAPDAWSALRVRQSSKCIDVTGASTIVGAAAVQYTCTGATNQQWSLRSSTPGHVTVVVRHTGQCLDVSGASTADNAPLVQYPCNGGANQEWSVRTTDVGQLTLVARHSGKCLDVSGGSTADNAPLVQSTCTGSSSQQIHLG
jgi:O-glycosyl hydrolase